MAFKLCARCDARKHAEPIKNKRSSNHARTKGLAFERWVAKRLRKIFPDVGRLLEFQAKHANGTDLEGTGDFRIQCKAFKNYAPISCLREVKICPIDGGVPVLVTKGDREPPVVVLLFDDFVELVRRSRVWREPGDGEPWMAPDFLSRKG